MLMLVYDGPAAGQIEIGLSVIVDKGGNLVGGKCVGKEL